MTKLTIEIPDELHRAVKSFASIKGTTIKDYFVELATEDLRKSNNMEESKSLKKSSKISTEKSKKSSKYITEKEADKMLKPYLLRLVKRIESGEEEVYSWEEAKKELNRL